MTDGSILIIGGPNTGKIHTARHICQGEIDVSNINSSSHSGIILKSELKTKYYNVNLTIFIDEFPEERCLLGNVKQSCEDMKVQGFTKWVSDFSLEECRELRESLRCLMMSFNMDSESLSYIKICVEMLLDLKEKIDMEAGSLIESFLIILSSLSARKDQAVEDAIILCGFEFTYLFEDGINEFREKLGKDRILEVIETIEWPDIKLSEFDANLYFERKESRIDEMVERLIKHDGDELGYINDVKGQQDTLVDLSGLLTSLKEGRKKALQMDPLQRREFAKTLVRDIIDYI